MMLESDLVKRIIALERRLAEIEAREKPGSVMALYYSNAGQTVANNTTVTIDYNTKAIDTHSAVTTGSSWKFTAPVTGYYYIHAAIVYSPTTAWGVGDVGDLKLYKNGTFILTLDRKDFVNSSSANVYLFLLGNIVINLNANDYIYVTTYQSSGSSLTIYSSWLDLNRIAIIKI